ncbi:MAG: VTT domain-containing protein [Candidatus Paceibacterota bacterium]|jgi:uncharacterized membrane protein YdjX (TVP38/TMEM64 family)
MKEFFRGYRDYIENIAGLVIIFAIMIAGFAYFDMARVQDFVRSSGIWAPIVLILAKASTMVFAPVSGSPLYPLAGALFGFWEGSAYLILGDLLGSTISFYISRVFGRRAVERFARGDVPVIDKILRFMETTRGFLVARVCFIALPEAVSYAAGLTRISFSKFVSISTVIGVIPIFLLAGAGTWISIGTDPWALAALIAVGLAVAAVGGIVFMRMTHREDSTTGEGGL